MKLWVFAIFTATVTIALGSVIGNFHPFRKQYPITATFEDATGLLKGDIVTVAGVTVGKVSGIKVADGYALVTLEIDKKVRLPKDTNVVVRYVNLLGQRTVLLQPGKARGPFLEAKDNVPVTQTEGPLSLDDVFNNLRPLLSSIEPGDVNTLSKALVTSFGGHQRDLDAILSDTAKLTQALAPHDKEIGELIAGLSSTAGSLADQRTELDRLLSNFSTLTSTLATKSGSLDKTLVNLDQASGDFAKLISGNRPALDRDISDIQTLMGIIVKHQADVDQVAKGLDDTLRATTRATGYGEWVNLYVFSLCTLDSPGCKVADVTSHGNAIGIGQGASSGQRSGLRKLLFDGLGGDA